MLGYEVIQKTKPFSSVGFSELKLSVTYTSSFSLPSLSALPLPPPEYQHPAMYLARWLFFLGTDMMLVN